MSTAWESLAEARTAAGEAAVRARGSTAEAEAVAAFVGVQEAMEAHRLTFMESAARVLPGTEVRDTDYVFIRFVLGELPAGLVGLLIAVILMAAMSSTASELNALGTTTVIDFYRRLGNPEATDGMLLRVSRLATVFWGFVALGFALFASLLANLIEAVNILGSLFYGPMLGIFVCALGMRRCRTVPVLVGALAGEATVLWLFWTSALGFLWYNLVGCMVVVSVAWVGSEPAGPGEGESTGKEPG
jgi:Na+/proline symporter